MANFLSMLTFMPLLLPPPPISRYPLEEAARKVEFIESCSYGGGGGSGTKLQTQGRWGGSIFGRDAV